MTQKRTTRSPARHVTHAVRQAVVPRRANDYRPHLIRFPSVIAIIFAVLMFQVAYNFTQTGSVLGQTTDVTARDLLQETNQARADNGEAPLGSNARLSQAAALKVNDMFAKQYWAHVSPSGDTPWTWFKQVGYGYDNAGENLAKDFHSTGGVVTAWMNSPEHRENILDVNYKDVGFAVKTGQLDGKSTTIVVALYGTPDSVPAVAGAATTTVAAVGGQSLISRIGVGVQSMTPALVGSISLLLMVAGIAVLAHIYRKRLPNSWRRSWKRHHGMYTAASAMFMIVFVITLYGGGQI